MSDLRDNIPPLALVDDTLHDCFGMREMEIAVMLIVRKCVEAGTWYVSFDRSMFVGLHPLNYTDEGFDELIEYEWLERSHGDHWVICEELVKRLMKRRGSCFV